MRQQRLTGDSVLQTKNYGSVRVHLDTILKERGMSKNRLATLADVSYIVVNNWCKGGLTRFDADVLARFCFVLKCGANDIITYAPNATNQE